MTITARPKSLQLLNIGTNIVEIASFRRWVYQIGAILVAIVLLACGGGGGSSSGGSSSVAPSISAQPTTQTVIIGQSAIFSVSATGTAPMSYQWYKNASAIPGATLATYTTPATVTGDNGSYFTVQVLNSAGTVTSNQAFLIANPAPLPPGITTQPNSQTVTTGQTATFTVTATGSAPLAYQWKRNGVAITGATLATYTIPSTVISDSGSLFTVVVSNASGSTTSNAATLTVTTPVAPVITIQPGNQSVVTGQTATFTVVAAGTSPLTYQWQKNGVAISGATQAAYTTTATVSADSGGLFTVTVSNVVGTITSNSATLTVTATAVAPSITNQPGNQTVASGQTTTFTVVVTGTSPLVYQWLKNGVAIPGAILASYTTPATVTADNGASFTVVVTNAIGSITSSTATLTVTVPVAPSITTQPGNQSVVIGQTATFTVVSTGTAPLAYQWQKNGIAISGATLASYTTPTTVAADSGSTFKVVVSNATGSITSNAATLTVTAPVAPTITTQPGNQSAVAGQTATFTVVASGTAPLAYQWQKSSVAISGATQASYTTPTTVLGDSGALFAVVVTNAVGSITSSAATLTVTPPVAPSITTQPGNQTALSGQTATFTVTASGSAPFTYQWKKNGTAISGATSASYTTPVTAASDNASTYSVVVTNAAGSAISNVATLTVNIPPAITTHPASQSVTTGQTATFSVTVSGTAPLTFQWRKNGTAIAGASAYAYTTPATLIGDSGSAFTVVISNSYGNVTSAAATLTVTAPVPPTITTQPLSQTVTVGQTATFGVLASGTTPYTFQWKKNGVAISGATAFSYTTPVTVAGDTGSTFSVVVTNAAGTATSTSATLTVNLAPLITAQPQTSTVAIGGSAWFTVTAIGAATLNYQWKLAGVNIVGATSPTYTIYSIQASQAGSYTVVVTNASGTATSQPAILSVVPTSSLAAGRYLHTATMLSNGKVLIVGGNGSSAYLSSAELYDPSTNTWSTAGSLTIGRSVHTATLLANGKVLVAGGRGSTGFLSNAELYDPSTNTWSSGGSLSTGRYSQTATLLGSGKVLVAGGYGSDYLSSAELYDPSTNSWSNAASLATARYSHTATLLGTGMVLVAGGYYSGNLSSAELYDPSTNTWSSAGSLKAARSSHTATLLGTGKLLVAGGTGLTTPLSSAELYDSNTNTWSSTSSLSTGRDWHTATLLGSGKVLVAGGNNSGYLSSAELYDPTGNVWSSSVPLAWARSQHTATLLATGSILLAGGDAFPATAEIYTPQVYTTGAPSITLQPANQSVITGQTAKFSVTATGIAPLTYQWRKNSTPVTLAISATYTTPATVIGDNAATFDVVISNSAGSSTSAAAVLTVSAPLPAPVINAFKASPTSIPASSGTILSWDVTGATTLSIDQSVGAVTGAVGTKNVSPSTTTTYTLTATNSTGTVTATAIVTVTSPVISSFTATPAAIATGGTSTLSWSVNGATTLSINQGVGTVTGTSKVVTPSATTTYTLTATNAIGSVIATTTVTVSSGVPTGTLQNVIPIWNSATGLVANALATLTKVGQTNVTGTSNANGVYVLTAPEGTGYGMTVAATNYISQTWYNLPVTAGVTTYLENVSMVSTTYATGTATASGIITSALDGSGIQGMTIKLYSGILNYNGSTVMNSATTGTLGQFSFSGLAPGYYTAVTSLSGYQSGYFTVVAAGGHPTNNLNFSVSPTLAANEIRIVTTWDAEPQILDNWLIAPSINGGSVAICYFNSDDTSSGGTIYCELNADVVTGYGPETTTIHIPLAGTYNFFVNDYNDGTIGGMTSGSPLAASNAIVKIYDSTGLVATFYVPDQPGTFWYVFDLDGTTGDITPINEMSFDVPENLFAVPLKVPKAEKALSPRQNRNGTRAIKPSPTVKAVNLIP